MWVRVFVFVLCACAANGFNVSDLNPADLSSVTSQIGLFRIDYQFYPKANVWLKLHRFPATWAIALYTCHLEGAVLASPINDDVAAVMKHLIVKEQLSSVYTGIVSMATPEDYTSLDGIPLKDIPSSWAKREPDNANGQEHVLFLSASGKMGDTSMNDRRPYFCYKKNVDFSLPNYCGYNDQLYEADMKTGHCYKFHKTPSNWHRALTQCAAEGGSLAVINSEEEAKFIDRLADRHYHEGVVHLGFSLWYYLEDRSPMVWWTLDGTPLNFAGFSTWANNELDNADGSKICGGFLPSTKDRFIGLVPTHCSEAHPFVCEIPPMKLPGNIHKLFEGTQFEIEYPLHLGQQ